MMDSHFSFSKITSEDLRSITSIREGEIRLGQQIKTDYEDTNVKFVLIGIEENIGPQANFGLPGAENSFSAFLKRFLNMQSNKFLSGNEIAIHGKIVQNIQFDNIPNARELVSTLDKLVEEIVFPIMANEKIPIVIGGGHNNALPLIRALFKVNNRPVSVINLDPHGDCRAIEGRHSGNSFSYASHESILERYTVIGLHKAYNSGFILNFLDSHKFRYSFFEDFISGKVDLKNEISEIFIEHESTENVGIELDLDSISYMPSSAFTPSGISLEDARFYLQKSNKIKDVSYLHLPEGAPKNESEEKIVGKALAYLVWDFIHSRI
jgi:formiminoglutamase